MTMTYQQIIDHWSTRLHTETLSSVPYAQKFCKDFAEAIAMEVATYEPVVIDSLIGVGELELLRRKLEAMREDRDKYKRLSMSRLIKLNKSRERCGQLEARLRDHD